MAVGATPLFGMLEEKMNWLSQRQRVLSQNIANADTPNYGARDLEAIDFRQSLRRNAHQMQLAKTSDDHVASPREQDDFRTDESRKVYETAPAGNKVVLEEQMMKLSETAGDYQMITGLYRKYLTFHQIALGRPGR